MVLQGGDAGLQKGQFRCPDFKRNAEISYVKTILLGLVVVAVLFVWVFVRFLFCFCGF